MRRRNLKTEFLTEYRGESICKNYGGYVVVNGYDYNIYKTLNSAINAVKKRLDGTNKNEPVIIRKMTVDEFINAFKI